jgi:hypothetical protein
VGVTYLKHGRRKRDVVVDWTLAVSWCVKFHCELPRRRRIKSAALAKLRCVRASDTLRLGGRDAA